jgi:phosphate transport system substrate-binding protein
VIPPFSEMRAQERARGLLALWSLTALLVAGAATAEPRPIVRVAGSDSMGGLMSALLTEFTVQTPGFLYELDARGSGTAPPQLLRGDVQIAAMTRELNTLEKRAFEARYQRQPARVAIAVDAVAIIVNPANPVQRLSLAQIDMLFGQKGLCGGKRYPNIAWDDVGATAWADKHVGVVVTPRTSGTREYFAERALCGGPFADGARELPGTASVLRALTESPQSVGYASRSALTPAVRPVPLEGRFGRPYSVTAEADVRSGKYPLTRSVYLYTVGDANGAPDPQVRAFMAFALSVPGQRIVAQNRFLPLTEQDAGTERARLD